MNPDDFPLSMFEVDCDGSACGSRRGSHIHPPQSGFPAISRVIMRSGKRVRYEPAQGIERLIVASTPITAKDTEAIMLAVGREVNEHHQWYDFFDMTIADLCAANQDALIDDLFERHPDDETHRGEMAELVRIYDGLLGTERAKELENIDGD